MMSLVERMAIGSLLNDFTRQTLKVIENVA